MNERVESLRAVVQHLAGEIGARSYLESEKLNRAAAYIEEDFRRCGLTPHRQPFTYRGETYCNVIAEAQGERPGQERMLVIGAHYDTVVDTPGADDNASGVAGLLELARLVAEQPLPRTVRFAAFTLEEPPTFMTSRMGSYVAAKSLHDEGAAVHGMISLEMLGYYADGAGTQMFPLPMLRWRYPDRGNFIAFVGNKKSRAFTEAAKSAFAAVSSVPVESINASPLIPGIGFSDHYSFWRFGYPAFMVTDTAFFRNPHYHAAGDLPETLDYERMAQVVAGLYAALKSL